MVPAVAVAYDCRRVAEAVQSVVGAHGLRCRGGFDFEPDEAGPALSDGSAARAVMLIGNAGAGYWPHFSRWRAGLASPVANPLDTWSRIVIEKAAASVGAHAVSPSDRPYLPFQRWAMRAEGLRPSPLGILMHPEFGLWHAYRGALLFGQALGFAAASAPRHACDACAEKPCLRACPVEAYGGDGFAYHECVAWVRGAEGGACLAYGCKDRNACPVGTGYRYPAEAQAFHMAAFAGA